MLGGRIDTAQQQSPGVRRFFRLEFAIGTLVLVTLLGIFFHRPLTNRQIVFHPGRHRHSLSINVIAEGLESEREADLLRSMGCRFAQGYLFGCAIEAGAVATRIERTLAA